MIDDQHIWVIAPKGFRPSNWVDMLRDFDVAFELDPYLVDPGYIEHSGRREEILIIRLDLIESFDKATVEYAAREALFWEMLDRVASLGLQVSFPVRMATEHPGHWDRAQEFCKTRAVTYSQRQLETLANEPHRPA